MTEFSINLEFAQRAFNGTSFNPERRGELFVKDFDDLLLRIKNKIFSDKILLDGQKQEIYERIASKLKVLAEKYLSAESRHVSVMIAGPAKFPVARQQKVMRSVEKNLNEYVDRIEWLQNGGLSKILYRNYPDEAKKDLEDKEDEKKLMVNAKMFVENKISEKDPEVFTFNAFPHLKGCFETCAKHKSFNACRKCIEFLESQLDFCRIQRNITILKRILSEAEEKSAQTPEKSVKHSCAPLIVAPVDGETNLFEHSFCMIRPEIDIPTPVHKIASSLGRRDTKIRRSFVGSLNISLNLISTAPIDIDTRLNTRRTSASIIVKRYFFISAPFYG